MKSKIKHLQDRVLFLEFQALDLDSIIARLRMENELLWELIKCIKSNGEQK